ncbi:MAG: hypothetical protein ABJF88_00150 [Rhodothermales bacterium]
MPLHPARTSSTHHAPLSPQLNVHSSTSTSEAPHAKLERSPVVIRRTPITDRMVQAVMVLTIVELEQDLIPAQGAGNILYVYAQDHEITHDVRRTLEVFDGDMNEAIDSIRTFVIDGIIGDPPRTR